jgi:hypothetical protein
MLADQLAQAGQQAEAYEVLDAALKAQVLRRSVMPQTGRAGARFATDDPSPDPWDQFKRGEARLVPAYLAQLREALR